MQWYPWLYKHFEDAMIWERHREQQQQIQQQQQQARAAVPAAPPVKAAPKEIGFFQRLAKLATEY